MKQTTTWTLLLVVALVGSAGAAFGQANETFDSEQQNDMTVVSGDSGESAEGAAGVGGDSAETFGGDSAETFGGDSAETFGGDSAETFGGDVGGGEMAAADSCNGGGLLSVGDSHREHLQERSLSQTVETDEDDVLLAIALANNGAEGITWDRIRDVDMTKTEVERVQNDADLERDDVFNALALGVDAEAGALETLTCISDVTSERTVTQTMNRAINLDENDVLLAIALANSVGGDLNFDEIADIEETERTEIIEDTTVDIQRDDAFLALALGAGGNDEGS